MLKVYQNDLKKVQQILRIVNHHIILRMQKRAKCFKRVRSKFSC